MNRHSPNTSGAVTDQPEQALTCAAREVIMRKCPALFLICVSSVLICGFGCSTRQARINQLHTTLAAEQQVINRDGRSYLAENEVVDRFNRTTLAQLKQLESR